MIENLPQWLNWLFLLTVALTIVFFHFANSGGTKLTLIIIVWSLGQSILAYTGFYKATEFMPPRFLLVLLPVITFIIFRLTKKPGIWVTQHRRTERSTFLHIVRVPVEIVLFYLFTYQLVPELMTFEGRNFDILAGITAPIVGLLWWKRIIGRRTLLVWNCMGMLSVLFIFVNGILSRELPIQLFGLEQPNRAITYFPFILLPATIVPIVIYTHLSDIVILWKENSLKKDHAVTTS